MKKIFKSLVDETKMIFHISFFEQQHLSRVTFLVIIFVTFLVIIFKKRKGNKANTTNIPQNEISKVKSS